MTSLADRAHRDERGSQPAADKVNRVTRNYIKNEMTPAYIDFMSSRIPTEVLFNVHDIADGEELVIGDISEKPFFVTDSDMGFSGAYGNAGAIVKPGKPGAPIRMIFTHSDVLG